MPILKPAIKRFITMSLARFEGVSPTMAAVKKSFDVEVSWSQTQAYDPTCYQGRALSKDLRELFASTRKAFIEQVENEPLAHKRVRLRELAEVVESAKTAGDRKSATKALELAAKEASNYYQAFAGTDVPRDEDRPEVTARIDLRMKGTFHRFPDDPPDYVPPETDMDGIEVHRSDVPQPNEPETKDEASSSTTAGEPPVTP